MGGYPRDSKTAEAGGREAAFGKAYARARERKNEAR